MPRCRASVVRAETIEQAVIGAVGRGPARPRPTLGALRRRCWPGTEQRARRTPVGEAMARKDRARPERPRPACVPEPWQRDPEAEQDLRQLAAELAELQREQTTYCNCNCSRDGTDGGGAANGHVERHSRTT